MATFMGEDSIWRNRVRVLETAFAQVSRWPSAQASGRASLLAPAPEWPWERVLASASVREMARASPLDQESPHLEA